ncbi:MAG: DUF4393 domain-containing protein [Lawsonibacter sp.]|nr:DUF4393 domain-containing protein [Lawsonibacter sp.]
MSDSSVLKDIASELPLKEAYQDLVHPTASAIGQTVSLPFRAVNILLTPISKWVLQGEANLNEMTKLVSEKVKDIPTEKLVEPEAYVAVPAMQAFSYSMNSDELKNLYANLLASAINSDTKPQVHPAYVEIIRQMSPLDARALEYFSQNGRTAIPLCNIRWQRKSSPCWTGFQKLRLEMNGSPVYFHLVNASEDGVEPSDISLSFENLDRLGLIQIVDDYTVNRDFYNGFEEHPIFEFYEQLYANHPESDKFELALLPAAARITSLGKAFCEICLSDTVNK